MAFFTKSGIGLLLRSLTGTATYVLNATNARIGVGNSAEAFDVAQTSLLGDAQALAGMVEGYPVVREDTIVFRALFRPEVANFDWNEIGIFNGLSKGVMLCRDVTAHGVKVPTQSWEVTVELTVS